MPSSMPISPSGTTWKRRSDCVTRDRTSRPAPSQPHFSRTNWRPCPPSTNNPNEERARVAEWDANHLRGQLGLAQQDLIRARNAHTTRPTRKRRTWTIG